jgi:circadian clock protein KaiC
MPGLPRKPGRHPSKVTILKLPTGVRGLDEILGGGIPEFSFNIIAGTPGCGKTTLAHQIVFANATVKNPALYFTVLGEPAIKMLRYQQQHSFFDEAKLGRAVRFINLSDVVVKQDLDAVLKEIVKQVTAINPGIVVVDSFRTMVRKGVSGAGEGETQAFIQGLAQFLCSWQATTFLVGEYVPDEIRDNPVFTVARSAACRSCCATSALTAQPGRSMVRRLFFFGSFSVHGE